ncbi:hypothetical protein Hanom_Chr11g01019071 [Helianthus anomalus]
MHKYYFFDTFHNTLLVLDNCTFIYITIHNILLFTLTLLEMHMCIYIYEHVITCFVHYFEYTFSFIYHTIHNTLPLSPTICNKIPLSPIIHNTIPLPVFHFITCISTPFIPSKQHITL